MMEESISSVDGDGSRFGEETGADEVDGQRKGIVTEISWGAGLCKFEVEADLTVELRMDSDSSNMNGSVNVLSFDEMEEEDEDSCKEELSMTD